MLSYSFVDGKSFIGERGYACAAILGKAISVAGQTPGKDDELTSGAGASGPVAEKRGPKLSRKMLAVVVVIVLVSASCLAIWYFYFRHWSASELADKLVKGTSGGYSGFESGLAGKSVVVEGKATAIDKYEMTLGTATVVELDGVAESSLVYWDAVSYEVGDRIERRVSFEWAHWNDEKHVYSPQVWLPFAYAYGCAAVMNAVSYVGSDGGMIRVLNEGNNVRVEIDWLGEPAYLNTTNCTLVGGTRSGMMDYYFIWDSDGHHNETDTIHDLTNRVGHNHTIEFFDENSDGYLDNGDSFLLRNLTRPETECGIKTYMFHVEWPLSPEMDPDFDPFGLWCYIPVRKGGAVWPAWWQGQESGRTPAVRGFLESDDGAQTLTIDYVSGMIPWENITIQLSDGTNFAQWEPTDPNPLAESLGIKKLGLLDVDANITHVAGSGVVSVGDRITVSAAAGDFSSSVVYSFGIVYEGTGELAIRKSFCLNDTPVAQFRPYPSLGEGTVNGTGFTFTPVHTGVNNTYRPFDLSWDDVIVSLRDGANNVSWTLSSNSLDLDVGSSACFGNLTLGSVDVFLYVWDLNGDGQANSGDRLELRTPGSTGFGSTTTYSITAIYSQKGTDICSTEFTG